MLGTAMTSTLEMSNRAGRQCPSRPALYHPLLTAQLQRRLGAIKQ